MVQNSSMHLDHISYVTSHEQLADTVQRLGSRIGGTFIDGGIHPRFGTRNFVLPLANGQYLEVVCPLDHPASDSSPFGAAVSRRSLEGGGWLSWVFALEDIRVIERRLSRSAILGHRVKPNGQELEWMQIGVLATIEDRQLPFFIEWKSAHHPSGDGIPNASIARIEMAGNKAEIENWIDNKIEDVVGPDIEIIWLEEPSLDLEPGIVAVHLETPSGLIRLD